jgi:hypothetical protein
MDKAAAILALMTAWGVGACGTMPASAQEADPVAEESSDTDESNPLLNRVWVMQGDASALPGVMHIFLADGTLVSDSCWETYRLSTWQQVSDTEISWDEDGMTINADITSVSESELVLNLKLVGGAEEHRFAPAEVPYVCPDIPK